MPAFKRTFRRRRFSKKGSKLSTRQKKEVKQLISRRVETQHAYWPPQIREVPIAPGRWILSNISNIQDGDQSYTQLAQDLTGEGRKANQIELKEVEFSYNLEMSQDGFILSAAPERAVRVILLRWMEDNHDANPGGPLPRGPNIVDILNPVNSQDYTVAPYFAEQKHKYHIMYDKVHFLINNAYWDGTAVKYGFGPKSCVHVRKRIRGKKLGAKLVQYTPDDEPAGSSFALGDGIGNIYAYAVSNNGSVLLVDDPTITFQLKFSYIDA